MKATVRHINPIRGMVAALTEDGDFSIFELLGDDVSVGDAVSWSGSTPLGGETITNHTQSRQFGVFFQNHHVTQSQLRQQLLL